MAIGPDRPGIVSTVSAFLAERGCNLEDSKMSVLGEDFSLAVLFSGEKNCVDKAQADIKILEKLAGLTTLLKDTKNPGNSRKASALNYKLEAFGVDHNGIVTEITAVLHKNKINVENMETYLEEPSASGTPVFHMSVKITLPSDLPLIRLKEELTKVEAKQNLKITLFPSKL